MKELKSTICFVLIVVFEIVSSLPVDESTQITWSVRKKILREVAKNLTEKSDSNVDICVNGIQNYSCSYKSENERLITLGYGSIIKRNEDKLIQLLEELDENDPNLSKSELRLKKFAKSCKNKNFGEQVANLEIAKDIGGWPLFTPDWDGSKFDWIQVLGKLESYEVSKILDSLVLHDNNNVTNIIISSSIVLNDIFLKRFLDMNEENFEEEEREKFISEVKNLSQQLKEYQFESTIESNEYGVSELKEKIDNFDWSKYLKNYLGDEIPPNIKVRIESVDKFKDLVNVLQNADKRILANYFLWEVIVARIGITKCFVTNLEFDVVTEKLFFTKLDMEMPLGILNEFVALAKNKLNDTTDLFEDRPDFKVYLDRYLDLLVGIEKIDPYFHDYPIDPNNHLQNVFASKAEELKGKINNLKNMKIHNDISFSDILNRGELAKDLGGYPTPIYFSYFGSQIWTAAFWGFGPLLFDKYNATIECLKNDFKKDNEDIVNIIVYNEALIFTYQIYKNWLENNKEISDKENEILSEFGLNNKKLFLLLLTNVLCHHENVIFFYYKLPKFDVDYNGIAAELYGCPDTKYKKCRT